MSHRMNFTKPVLEAIQPGDTRTDYHDAKTAGLTLRVTPTGAKTFCVLRRVKGGKLERVTIGQFPAVSIEQARRKALEITATLAQGTSLTAQRERTKQESRTLGETLEAYLTARKTLKEPTRRSMRGYLRRVCGDWLDKPLTAITSDVVTKLHAKHRDTPAQANLAMRYLRAVINYAMAQQDEDAPLIKANPVKRLTATRGMFKVERRTGMIALHELPAWWQAVEALPSPDWRDYFQLVLLTGLRKEEALGLQWADIELVAGTLMVTGTKNHSDHTLPLGGYLHALLSRRKALAVTPYVFANSAGQRLQNPRHSLDRIAKETGKRFIIHDLRRTFATIAESLDIPAYALKRLMNHAGNGDVTQGYIVATPERLRAPMQKIEDYILRAVAPGNNVVAFPSIPGNTIAR